MERMSDYSYAKYVNGIAIEAMRDYMPFIKAYPTYGWKIRNAGGPDDNTPGRNDLYYVGRGYSFAKALMIAASCKEQQPYNDIHLEPMLHIEKDYDWKYSKWCLDNNLKTGAISEEEYREINKRLYYAMSEETWCPYHKFVCYRSGDCIGCRDYTLE